MSQGGINSVTSGVLPPDVPLQFTADVGIAVPAASNLNIFGGTATNTVGAGSTITINMDVPVAVPNGGTGQITLTNHGVLVGAGINPITQLAVGNTNTVLLGSTGADPAFGQVPNAALANSSITLNNGNNITITGSPISLGGAATINVSGTLDHSVQLGNSSGSLTSLANGTTGQLLTAQTGADPMWAAPAASSISITGNTGGAQIGNSFTFTGGTTGLSFGGSSGTFTTTFAGITANNGAISLSTDAANATVLVGTGAAIKTSTFGSATASSITTLQSGGGGLTVSAANNGSVSVTGGAINVAADNGTALIINLGTGTGTGVAGKTINIGSTTAGTSIAMQTSAVGASLTTSNGPITINSGTGPMIFSSDSANTSVSLGTGSGVKVVTVGSINTTSSTAIQSGTGSIIHNSGFRVDSTGRSTNPNQPGFFAYLTATVTNATGDGTLVSPVPFNATTFNRGSGFNTATSTFTVPVTGIYAVTGAVRWSSLSIAFTRAGMSIIATGTTPITLAVGPINPGTTFGSGTNDLGQTTGGIVFLTAGDTVIMTTSVTGSTKTIGLSTSGTNYQTYLSAILIA